ncbi:unnamed protein product [Rhodiola kirilowii]
MSVIKSSELQIWDNAAFDCGGSLDAASIRNSWSSISAFQPDDNKENTITLLTYPPSLTPPKPLHLNNRVAKNSTTCLSKQACPIKRLGNFKTKELGFGRYEERLNREIEDIEKEMNRLSCRLQELKRERNAERCGRVASMEQDQLMKLEDSLLTPNVAGVMSSQYRGFSISPPEIITAGAKTRRMISKMEASSSTPINQKQDRNKSCFWKLDQIDELKMTKERGRGGRSMSLSPRTKKDIPKLPIKQAATTLGSRKKWNKDERVISSVQPKNLFKEGDKKPVRAGRVVASRYNNNQEKIVASNNKGSRKRLLPENEASKGNEKKRASLEVKVCSKEAAALEQQQCRVKKKWEIPVEAVMVYDNTIDVDDDQTGSQLSD